MSSVPSTPKQSESEQNEPLLEKSSKKKSNKYSQLEPEIEQKMIELIMHHARSHLIKGEVVGHILPLITLQSVHWPRDGSVIITNLRILFLEGIGNDPENLQVISADGVFSVHISLTSLLAVKMKNKSSEFVDLICKTKLGRTFHLLVPHFVAHKATPDLPSLIFSFIPRAPPKLFAFSNEEFSSLPNNPEAKEKLQEPNAAMANGWLWYDERKELARIMRGLPEWRETEANVEYQLCKTYPRYLGVPSALTDDDLFGVSKFRSSNRLPILSWIHPETKASIVRCSQPLVGMKRNRSSLDEKYFALVRASNESSLLYILDARPKANVLGNTAMGGGVEDSDFYPQCEIEFLDISNIHAMRDSFHKMNKLVSSQGNEHRDDSNWLSNLSQTQWLSHMNTILVGTVRVIDIVEQGCSVISHCSDGWDRTSQLTSLAMLLMDSAYRTLQGFAILIEKEWIGAGHKFSQRCGNSEFVDDKDQSSPIFLQFLDAVHQCVLQFPTAFEFNEAFLLFLAEEYYSCRFGTFLYNNDRLRRVNAVPARTPSIWTYVHAQRRRFVNPFYKNQASTLRPLAGHKRLRVWESFFLAFAERPDAPSAYQARQQLARAFSEEKEHSKNMWDQIDMLKGMIRTLDEENRKLAAQKK